jgi:hypothetical protein
MPASKNALLQYFTATPDGRIPIKYTADPKTRQLTVKAELANPITQQEREQLLRSMSLIYGSNNASVEINMSKNALEIRGSYQW